MKMLDTHLATLSLLAVVPKSDKTQDKNQDSAHYNLTIGRFAVADGVSRMLLSELFSRSLTARFCEAGNVASMSLFETQDWQSWLLPSCKAWRESAPLHVAAASGLAQTTLTNRWNAGHHGGATFAGIEIKSGYGRESLRWQAMVIGDCCVIQLDAKGHWLKSHVIQASSDFDSRPEMFVSGAEDNLPAPTFIRGVATPGDSFILASDTMAKWLLQQHESDNWPEAYAWLMSLNDTQAFIDHINHLRSGPPVMMDDDDITLMLVKVAPAQPLPPRVLMPAPTRAVVDLEDREPAPPYPRVTGQTQDRRVRRVFHYKDIAVSSWATVRPYLTRGRAFAAVAIVLVLTALLLLVQSLNPKRVDVATSPLRPPLMTSTPKPYVAREVLISTSTPALQP